jgi:hypothetical protein
MAQQLLHDLQLCTGRSKQRRIGVAKSMPADSLGDAQFSRNRNDMVPHDLLGQERPTTDAALKEFITKYSSSGAFQVAQVYALRNQRDEAFEWLDRAYAQREGNVAYTNLDPMLNNLRSDPRYPAFLKKRNLPN